jgi:iron complex transport system permease protein
MTKTVSQTEKPFSPMRKTGVGLLLILAPAVLFVLYMNLGKYSCSLFSPLGGGSKASFVILKVRLPRATEAALFGAVMGITGAALQTTLRNPLVSPYILGASSGAAFGAALSIALFGNRYFLLTQPSSLLFALVAIFLALGLSRFKGSSSGVYLVLAGIIVSALFSGLLSFVQIMVEPEKTQTIVAWMIGRLSSTTWKDVMVSSPLAVLGILGLLVFSWRIFVISSGDDEARSLGLRVERERNLVVILATIATAAVVSVAGVIGWVCLITPHITRFIVGPHPRTLLPASISVGASFMLLADLISRTVWAFEMPVGIVTTLVGAPLFLYLMRRSLYEWN